MNLVIKINANKIIKQYRKKYIFDEFTKYISFLFKLSFKIFIFKCDILSYLIFLFEL